ncbi:MAG TPA: twin-arginine translocation signal domain-containing protein [Planctomycetes bacterium]|nr:twin-arginine translocation signal domain-containing protein [Planctomycetota bacterium]
MKRRDFLKTAGSSVITLAPANNLTMQVSWSRVRHRVLR